MGKEGGRERKIGREGVKRIEIGKEEERERKRERDEGEGGREGGRSRREMAQGAPAPSCGTALSPSWRKRDHEKWSEGMRV